MDQNMIDRDEVFVAFNFTDWYLRATDLPFTIKRSTRSAGWSWSDTDTVNLRGVELWSAHDWSLDD